jgi:streptogramin lyase
VKFDLQGNNLYLLNTTAPTTAMIRYSNGSFSKLDHTELMKLNTRKEFPNSSNAELSKMIIDSQGIMWFVNNNWTLPAFYQYDMENDAIRAYESFTNEDGTKIDVIEGVRCIVEDRNNDLWLGSSAGPFVLKRSDIDQERPTYVQVKVPRNDGTNYADYLLAGIDIMSIAIDGGGRKWFGTNGNGVYLISADNMSQIQHFTTDNSALLSNVVRSIAINPTTGEVFFGTDNGLCSYMSDATQTNTEMNSDNVWAYPNPVNPGYTGLITITGLTYNADVKIVASNGALVNEGRSNGGTYTWDGCDQKGRRVASGVYMVITATNTGEKGTVCKIAIVR